MFTYKQTLATIFCNNKQKRQNNIIINRIWGGGGGGGSHMKGVGMLVISLRVFWAKHHYLAVKVSFRVAREEIMYFLFVCV